jgi:hypothetical protein
MTELIYAKMHDLVLYGHNRLHYRFIRKICMYNTVIR